MLGFNLPRKPFALANWKMAMTISQSLTFVRDFQALAGGLLTALDVVICPPFTALWPVAQALENSPLQLGAQNVADSPEAAHTGQVSAAMLVDAGCRWVMLGHWEVRRCQGDDDEAISRKVHLSLEVGLRPILLVGEGRQEVADLQSALRIQLSRVLAGCQSEQVSRMAFVYEPEAAIGASEPAHPGHVSAGCGFIRSWLRDRWGSEVSEQARILYGGSVSPEHVVALLADPNVDGLGASRQGRTPATFFEIVRQVVAIKKVTLPSPTPQNLV